MAVARLAEVGVCPLGKDSRFSDGFTAIPMSLLSTENLEQHYSTTDTAALLGRTSRIIVYWIKTGTLRASKLPTGRYAVPRSEIVRVLSMAGGVDNGR